MIRKATAATLCAALVVASCTTPYGPRGAMGGYTDEKLTESHYRVKFDGNANSSADHVWGFWLHRCAELTKQKGYTHFTLLTPGEPLSDRGQSPLNKASYRPGAAAKFIRTKGGSGGGYVYVPTYNYVRTTTWHTDAVVSMYRGALPEYVLVLDAQVVLDQLGPYVKSDGMSKMVPRADVLRRATTVNLPASDYAIRGML